MGHERKVQLVADRDHFIRTLSLKPLLFGKSAGRSGKGQGLLRRGRLEAHFDHVTFVLKMAASK